MVASLTTYYISTLLDALCMVPSLSMVHFQLAWCLLYIAESFYGSIFFIRLCTMFVETRDQCCLVLGSEQNLQSSFGLFLNLKGTISPIYSSRNWCCLVLVFEENLQSSVGWFWNLKGEIWHLWFWLMFQIFMESWLQFWTGYFQIPEF